MKVIKIAICDDEKCFIDTIEKMLKVYEKKNEQDFFLKIKPKSDYPLKTLYPRAFQTGQNHLIYYDFTTVE